MSQPIVLETNDYYPFGLAHQALPVSSDKNKYQYNSKEFQDELGLNWNDYGARNYDAAIGRWMNVDPLAEKYFDTTTYSYVCNDPVNYIDPDGMDRYLINDAGETILALAEKNKPDMLFAVGNQKIKNATIDKISDTNEDGKQDDNDGITIKSKNLIGQLTSKRLGSEKNIKGGYYSSIGEQSEHHEQDYKKLFKYIADNTQAEFSLTFFKDRGKKFIQLSTLHDRYKSPSPDVLGIEDPNKNVSRHYHSHPGIRTAMVSENYSMGFDYNNAKSLKRTYPNYVYFPNTSRLWRITIEGTAYIKNINSSKDF